MDFEMDVCGGCLTCEIACSYKHSGVFNHVTSSIEIVELEDKSGFKVRIHDKNTDKRVACNGCYDIDGDPMCVRYCIKSDALTKIIDEYKTKKGMKK